ncbi:MAG: Smr/MutS family protein [Pseudomonadota bacterium]
MGRRKGGSKRARTPRQDGSAPAAPGDTPGALSGQRPSEPAGSNDKLTADDQALWEAYIAKYVAPTTGAATGRRGKVAQRTACARAHKDGARQQTQGATKHDPAELFRQAMQAQGVQPLRQKQTRRRIKLTKPVAIHGRPVRVLVKPDTVRTVSNNAPEQKARTQARTIEPPVAELSRPRPTGRRTVLGEPAAMPTSASGNSGGDLTRRQKRAMKRGRLPIDAQIDLHGLNRQEAERELLAFLRRSQRAGLGYVRVITGKGRVSQNPEPAPFWQSQTARERGVLRSAVPRWFHNPQFKVCVEGWTTAAQHDGGEGALLVRLRRSQSAG